MATDKGYAAEMDAIKNDVKKLRDDMASLIGTIGDDASERGKKVGDEARKHFKAARKRGEESLEDVEAAIERNPLMALTTALGIGFLIGALISRR